MKIVYWQLVLIILLFLNGCKVKTSSVEQPGNIRQVVDTVGFAHCDWQMDSVVSRISTQFGSELQQVAQNPELSWRAAICPHDDYTYASWLYPAVLRNVKAKTLIIFGVAHKARNYNLQDKIVFDSFDAWQEPYGEVKVSPLRKQIMDKLPEDIYLVHDSMQMVEQSVESMIPFLQKQNSQVEIISILVPYMEQSRMDTIANYLSSALHELAISEHLEWGKDFSILITSDAVHYGCEEWGGKNYARFGCDSVGYEKALAYEMEIINNCFVGELSDERTNRFIEYTVQENNYKEYKWTWCGRYSVPLGLKVADKLQKKNNSNKLEGVFLAYETTISHPELKVKDLRMGKTANAQLQHWVGLPAIGFK